MTSASLSLLADPWEPDAEAVLLVAAARADGAWRIRSTAARLDTVALAADLDAVGFRGLGEEVVRLPGGESGFGGIAVVGLGERSSGAADGSLRIATAAAMRRIGGEAPIVVDLDAASGGELTEIVEGAGLGSYRYTKRRGAGSATDESGAGRRVAVVSGRVDGETARAVFDRAVEAVTAVESVRDLVNLPALDLSPEALADQAVALAQGLPLAVEVWDAEKLEQDGFGGILGVGRGSSRPPRLVKLSYRPEGAASHLALVGKGITFDSGGLSLKPPLSMVGMKDDMAGAATVLATVVAAARLALPVRITSWLCLAENMPSGDAIRPGDVLTAHGGRTIEVLNTDAEGRLVLADGLVAACAENPDVVVDVATLTGAAVVALGTRYTAAMGDDDQVDRMREAARDAGEPLWPMPLPHEMRALLDSDVADIANVKPGNTAGGMLVAGVFLREFVGDRPDGTPVPWVHLDVAGPAYNKESAYGYTPKGGTGAMVRTLLRFAEMYTRA
ncbi:leucyl aminopeptidase [Herbiconiux moechotypicola]|uniref:Probable cytosol aminopeptidase n=1 Tax=Herbiconiux moechotypicola TaxID=637393 RepID=A0ABP5Q4M6_9MICO|nr:leucyl aminopeptidase [Herbiconiux moechotypicola]MCS5728553.1 leucyl aminopeptidase [Herbiconiux moechotypicola]